MATVKDWMAEAAAEINGLYLNADGKKYLEPILNAPHWDVPTRVATEERRGHVRWGKREAK